LELAVAREPAATEIDDVLAQQIELRGREWSAGKPILRSRRDLRHGTFQATRSWNGESKGTARSEHGESKGTALSEHGESKGTALSEHGESKGS
jgi:hypothetical protein